MENRYTVFICSTYQDMVEERKVAVERILSLNCIPLGMEFVKAENCSITDSIKHVIDMADYFLLILGNRYGALTADNISFVEVEYNYALSKNIPIFVFIKEDEKSSNSDIRRLLFRERLLNDRLVKFWSSISDLSLNIWVELSYVLKSTPSKGLIKEKFENIFLSYSWNDATLANKLDERFNQIGVLLKRDIRDIKYRQSIKSFMKQIRKNDYVILLISRSYLQSINCMFEVLELVKDDNYKDRILPIIKKDSDIFNVIGRTRYIEYWQVQYTFLSKYMAGIDDLNREKIIDELKRIESVKRTLPDFLDTVSDMKVVVCDGDDINQSDFNDICSSIFEIR